MGDDQRTPNATFTYDAAGNRSSATQKDSNQVVLGSMSYQYDELSRLTSESYQFADLTGTYALNYGYNLANELTSLSIPFTSQAIGYNYDTAGRLNSVSASGFSASYWTPWPNSQTFTQTLTSFISNITYRAWGGRKSITYGNTVSESTNYNARLQPTSYTINNVNYTNTNVWPNTSFSSMSWTYDYYADGRVNHAYDSTWNFWDRSYSYDHAARLQEADTNRVARGQSWDFWHPDPYQQTSTYDVWNNLKLTGYLYNNQQNDWSSYTNNRRSDLGYDADGNVTWNPGYNNTIDVRGLNVGAVTTRTVGNDTTQFPTRPAEDITQTYDANGRPSKRTDLKRENVYDDETGNLIQVLEDNQINHYIYSSVLGAQVVDLDGSGVTNIWVYAGGQRIATASAGANANTTFEHHNPVSVSRVTTNGHSGSRAAGRQERDPQTGPVPLENGGGVNAPVNWNQPLAFIGGDPSDFAPGVTADGMPVTRADLARRMGSGSLAMNYTVKDATGLHVVQGSITPLGLGMFEREYPKPDYEGWHWSAQIFSQQPSSSQNPQPTFRPSPRDFVSLLVDQTLTFLDGNKGCEDAFNTLLKGLGQNTGIAPAAGTIRGVLELFRQSGTIYPQTTHTGAGGGILGTGTASVGLGMINYGSTESYGDRTLGDWFFQMFLHEVTHGAAREGPVDTYTDEAFYNVFATQGIYSMTPAEFESKYGKGWNTFSTFSSAATEFYCTGFKRTIIK